MSYTMKRGIIAPSHMTCATCAFAPDCQFDVRQRGGFKGDGPKYIGYRLITDRAEMNGAKEDTTTCFNFIESGLQKRMTVGRNLRDDGKDGDRIKIIAQEEAGPDNWKTTVKQSAEVGFNLRGEIVKPQPHLVEHFKRAGYKVSTELMSPVAEWRVVEWEVPVPKFREEQARVTGYKQSVMARELAEEEAAVQDDDEAWERARAKKVEPKAEPVKKAS